MSGIQEVTRIFRFGSIQLPDPDPSMAPEKIRDMYAVNYPLTSAMVEGPRMEGTSAIYEFKPAPVKTKG